MAVEANGYLKFTVMIFLFFFRLQRDFQQKYTSTIS